MSQTDNVSTSESNIEQHSIIKSIILHLLPGILILIFYIIVGPIFERNGIPSMNALLLAIAVVLIPFELGFLLYQGKKKNGRFSLKGIVLYRKPVRVWQYIAIALPCIVWAILFFTVVTQPIDKYLIGKVFFWLPEWFNMTNFVNNIEQYSQASLLWAVILGLVFNGIAGPVVEELYFRGYLLPRISRLKGWAPLVNVALFSIYHFFTPWQNPARILAILPMVYAVWWKKNIYIGIIIHCLINIITLAGIILVISLA
ncbi:MAG: CPBP family intramembrane metalloprotease [Actinobacteria bacterium]|nr:CPBP family intramembrane metalloprotease [Actinomycetota bacterium]